MNVEVRVNISYTFEQESDSHTEMVFFTQEAGVGLAGRGSVGAFDNLYVASRL